MKLTPFLRDLRETAVDHLGSIAFLVLALCIYSDVFAQGTRNMAVIDPPYALSSCMPGTSNATHIATVARVSVNAQCGSLHYFCIPRDEMLPIERYRYASPIADVPKWGTRIQTIAKAADPLASLRTAGMRFTITPLTDPSVASCVAVMDAGK